MTAGSTEETVKPTIDTMVKSLTGFDEIAIEQAFHADLADVMESSGKVLRALIFVMKKREGLSDHDAFLYAMNVKRGDVDGHFTLSTEVDDEGKAPEPDSTENGPSSS